MGGLRKPSPKPGLETAGGEISDSDCDSVLEQQHCRWYSNKPLSFDKPSRLPANVYDVPGEQNERNNNIGSLDSELPRFDRKILNKLRTNSPKLNAHALRRIDLALSKARVSEPLKEILAEVALERGWLYRPEETQGLIQNLVRKVEGIPSEPEQIEFLLEDERAPQQLFEIAPAPLPEEFSKLNDGKYEAYTWRPSRLVFYSDVVVLRDGKPWHGEFSFLSMKRFDRILGIGNSGFGDELSADITLDHGKVVRLIRKGFKGETTHEVVPESALEGARTEPVSYFVVQGSTHEFGHDASIAGVADKDGCFRFPFEWRWNETREIYPSIGQLLVGGIETNKGASGYVDLDQRRTVVFPKKLSVEGVGDLFLSRLSGPGNKIAEYTRDGKTYKISLEQGEGTSAPYGRLDRN